MTDLKQQLNTASRVNKFRKGYLSDHDFCIKQAIAAMHGLHSLVQFGNWARFGLIL